MERTQTSTLTLKLEETEEVTQIKKALICALRWYALADKRIGDEEHAAVLADFLSELIQKKPLT